MLCAPSRPGVYFANSFFSLFALRAFNKNYFVRSETDVRFCFGVQIKTSFDIYGPSFVRYALWAAQRCWVHIVLSREITKKKEKKILLKTDAKYNVYAYARNCLFGRNKVYTTDTNDCGKI